MHQPYLVGKKVYLRVLDRGDLIKVLQWVNDPEITQFMYMGSFPSTIDALEYEYQILMESKTSGLLQLPNYPTDIVFAIIDKVTDCHIGNIGLFGINWIQRVGEMRVIIGDDKYRGGGYAFESYCLIIKYAFDRLNLHRLTAGVRIDHIGAIMALKKVGFVKEGRQREHFLRNEQTYDVLLFGLLRDEFFVLFPNSKL